MRLPAALAREADEKCKLSTGRNHPPRWRFREAVQVGRLKLRGAGMVEERMRGVKMLLSATVLFLFVASLTGLARGAPFEIRINVNGPEHTGADFPGTRGAAAHSAARGH